MLVAQVVCRSFKLCKLFGILFFTAGLLISACLLHPVSTTMCLHHLHQMWSQHCALSRFKHFGLAVFYSQQARASLPLSWNRIAVKNNKWPTTSRLIFPGTQQEFRNSWKASGGALLRRRTVKIDSLKMYLFGSPLDMETAIHRQEPVKGPCRHSLL